MVPSFQALPYTEAQIRSHLIKALSDPSLSAEGHQLLIKEVLRLWAKDLEGFEIQAVVGVVQVGLLMSFEIRVRIIPLN